MATSGTPGPGSGDVQKYVPQFEVHLDQKKVEKDQVQSFFDKVKSFFTGEKHYSLSNQEQIKAINSRFKDFDGYITYFNSLSKTLGQAPKEEMLKSAQQDMQNKLKSLKNIITISKPIIAKGEEEEALQECNNYSTKLETAFKNLQNIKEKAIKPEIPSSLQVKAPFASEIPNIRKQMEDIENGYQWAKSYAGVQVEREHTGTLYIQDLQAYNQVTPLNRETVNQQIVSFRKPSDVWVDGKPIEDITDDKLINQLPYRFAVFDGK